jgi:predicted lysophospholipase L1 biosynthesis ABC-type transport system permease subunit
VRRRHRTFAVLSALGMDRRGLRRSVRWQLALLTVVTLVAGIPLGIAAGRVAWTAFADLLGTASGPRVPVLLLVAVAAGVLVLANLLGERPARSASRHGRAPLSRD